MDRWSDQWLGEQVGTATREDVLEDLRGHIYGDVVLFVEASDGTLLLSVHGTLMEGNRDPDTWETAEEFVVIGLGENPQVWHMNEETRRRFGKADIQPAATIPTIPDKGIEPYPGVDAGASGYRFDLGGGATIALLLWHGVLHLTASGDVAPGMGDFTATIEEVRGDEETEP